MARERKRFIAGAVCPSCKAMDTLMLFTENNIEQVECVTCKHQMSQPKAQGAGSTRTFDNVIGVFDPSAHEHETKH